MDEVYASLAYDGAPLLCIPVCVSRALLVFIYAQQILCVHFCDFTVCSIILYSILLVISYLFNCFSWLCRWRRVWSLFAYISAAAVHGVSRATFVQCCRRMCCYDGSVAKGILCCYFVMFESCV